jgi:hypothetical protein
MGAVYVGRPERLPARVRVVLDFLVAQTRPLTWT